jgi:hypothetical protein
MPKATVRANAQTLPEAAKSTSAAPDSPESAADEYLRLRFGHSARVGQHQAGHGQHGTLGGGPMTSVTKDYWPAYSALESQLRDVARMATITRGYAHDIDWPKELTADQDEGLCSLFMLVGHVEDMANALVKTYDSAFGRVNPASSLAEK